MSARRPKTLPEWRTHLATLEGEDLWNKAIAANSSSFVRMLQDEGYEAKDIHTILIYLAQRFRETGLRPPGDGIYDYQVLMQTPPPAG